MMRLQTFAGINLIATLATEDNENRGKLRLAVEDYRATPKVTEIVDVVTEIGSKVEKFKVGEKVGVGVLVGSCRSCAKCCENLENHCTKQVQTCGVLNFDGTKTYEGYSESMTADEHFVVHWPNNLALDSGAPLLCAGITTYSPLTHFGFDKLRTKVCVVGLGRLGHVAVKMAKAFGAHVTLISTSESKKKEAFEKLGADSLRISRVSEQLQIFIFFLKSSLHI